MQRGRNHSIKEEAASQVTAASNKNENFVDYRLLSHGSKGRGSGNGDYKRHHVMRFQSSKPVDLKYGMTHPLHLQRKSTDAIGKTFGDMDSPSSANGLARNVNTDGRAGDERGSKEQADINAIAPYGGAQFSKRNQFKKLTRQVIHEDAHTKQLQEEESRPWVLEDFDGKNTWVGTMEGGQSYTHALFVLVNDGFVVVPADRWYRFNRRQNYKTLSIDEAEAKVRAGVCLLTKMNRPGAHMGRWIMKNEQGERHQERPRMRTVVGERNVNIKRERREDEGGADELDFDEDFADDEGAPIIEGNDEDNKDVEDKIKKEMLTANALGEAEQEPEEEELVREPKMNKDGKKLQRYLKSLEKNMVYESDEEENPYASETSQASSDDKQHVADQDKGFLIGGQLGGRNGSTIPSRPSSALADRNATAPKNNPLLHKLVVLQISGMKLAKVRPNPNARLPDWVHFKSQTQKKRRGPASDMESIGEASENDGNKKIRLHVKNAKQPQSRQSSPSRAVSPPGSMPESPVSEDNLITEGEVAAVIASKPMTTKEFANHMKPRLRLDERNKQLLTLYVKRVAKLENNVLVPRN